MNITFENKVVLITGAASGIGLKTAQSFAKSGAKAVVLADWNEKLAQEEADKLKKEGYQTLAISCDVSNELQVKEMIEKNGCYFWKFGYCV